jgi:pimeloyl-ACP methyl ester carboxylesterase
VATFLLVHGGFCRSWVWDDTATALAARGHRVEAVDLPTSGTDPATEGLQDDVDTVRQALDASSSGTVLVGHSSSGMVLAELANHPAVQHSVYVAAFRPERGQSIADMLGGQIPGWMEVRPEEGVVRVSDSPAVVRQALCADVEESRFLRDVYPRFVPSSLKIMASTSSAPAPGHDTTYVICDEDQAVPVAAQQAMSTRSDRVGRLPSSHNPMLSMPERLVQVLQTAVPAVADNRPS